jgi:hypothetical protein
LDASAPEINPKFCNIRSGVKGLGKLEEVIPDDPLGLRVGRPDKRISWSLPLVFYCGLDDVIDSRNRFPASPVSNNDSESLV